MSAQRLTAAERNALKLATNAALAVRKSVPACYRVAWFDGYMLALRGMAETLPWARRFERRRRAREFLTVNLQPRKAVK